MLKHHSSTGDERIPPERDEDAMKNEAGPIPKRSFRERDAFGISTKK